MNLVKTYGHLLKRTFHLCKVFMICTDLSLGHWSIFFDLVTIWYKAIVCCCYFVKEKKQLAWTMDILLRKGRDCSIDDVIQ